MPFIKKETIEKVFESADLVEVIGDYVELKKSGAQYKGKSPFTDEKSGSFMVSVAKGIWKDFSSGKGGNNAVSFLMELPNALTYPEVIEQLANKYGIPIEYEDSAQAKAYQEKVEKREALRPLLEAAIQRYEDAFEKLPADHPAKKEVFEKRGYSQEIVDAYRIGYAPGKKFLFDLCKENGRVKDAQELGLISETNDKWYDRVIYPLIEQKGSKQFPVGIAGRRLSEDKKYAKWMNSSDSDLYKKDSFWYGLDKAREEIARTNTAWLTEGYNDVIAWQTHGLLNTIASCGTAISENQMKLLRKLCEHAVFCMDQDAAGIKAMLKYIPEFMKAGFRVHVVSFLGNLDPDDFVRKYKLSVNDKILSRLNESEFWDDGFKFLMEASFKGKSEVDQAIESKKLCEILSEMKDDALQSIYIKWLANESSVTLPTVKAWVKEFTAEKERKYLEIESKRMLSGGNDEFYILPESVKTPLDDLRKTIERYQLFQANNQIWIQTGSDQPYHFKSVSNFSIEIIQHMQDEKFPMKLVRIKNVHKLERIFDMQSADMNTPNAFENAVTAHGNFRWKGGRKEHELLKTYLFDGMGTGRKIDVLGWQPECFWVWNNKITVPAQNPIILDENGVFEKDDVMYYVPSANQIYRSNVYKYEAQKKVISIDPPVTFQNYADQVLKVHRSHGMMGVLFSIASIFQDIVVSQLNFFPMLFLFGPASSGKDLLADCCQSFFGNPQTAINLEGGVSTIKAQVREFAQFSNTISQLSEYKNGDPKLDGVLKGLWDRRGYKRGNIDSHVGTESIPILSSVIMTGNFAPDQEALITRFIWNFMDKTSFNDDEIKEYEKLADMNKKGISGFTNHFLRHRSKVQNNFKAKFREFKATLSQRHDEANARMIANLSVLGTFFQMFVQIPEFHFPFTHTEMLEHFDKTIELQMNKMSTASIINRWWDCFLQSMRGTVSDQIRVGRDFKLEGDRLYFNFTSCYNRVSRQWYQQYKNETAPAKGVMMDNLKKDKSWVGDTKATRMAPGAASRSTSAYIVNINQLQVADEIKLGIDFQMYDDSLFAKSGATEDSNPSIPFPVTHDKKLNGKDERDDLPF